MPRKARISYAKAFYHIISRGNNGQVIFHDDEHREIFLETLQNIILEYDWSCYAYCLMENHYHLLIYTPENNISEGMHRLNLIYTQRYKNINFHHTGHLFQDRFKGIIIIKDSHLLELCRYIALNPVRANMVESPEKYRWSSYRATAKLEVAPAFLDIKWILECFNEKSIQKAAKKYAHFVSMGDCPHKSG